MAQFRVVVVLIIFLRRSMARQTLPFNSSLHTFQWFQVSCAANSNHTCVSIPVNQSQITPNNTNTPTIKNFTGMDVLLQFSPPCAIAEIIISHIDLQSTDILLLLSHNESVLNSPNPSSFDKVLRSYGRGIVLNASDVYIRLANLHANASQQTMKSHLIVQCYSVPREIQRWRFSTQFFQGRGCEPAPSGCDPRMIRTNPGCDAVMGIQANNRSPNLQLHNRGAIQVTLSQTDSSTPLWTYNISNESCGSRGCIFHLNGESPECFVTLRNLTSNYVPMNQSLILNLRVKYEKIDDPRTIIATMICRGFRRLTCANTASPSRAPYTTTYNPTGQPTTTLSPTTTHRPSIFPSTSQPTTTPTQYPTSNFTRINNPPIQKNLFLEGVNPTCTIDHSKNTDEIYVFLPGIFVGFLLTLGIMIKLRIKLLGFGSILTLVLKPLAFGTVLKAFIYTGVVAGRYPKCDLYVPHSLLNMKLLGFWTLDDGKPGLAFWIISCIISTLVLISVWTVEFRLAAFYNEIDRANEMADEEDVYKLSIREKCFKYGLKVVFFLVTTCFGAIFLPWYRVGSATALNTKLVSAQGSQSSRIGATCACVPPSTNAFCYMAAMALLSMVAAPLCYYCASITDDEEDNDKNIIHNCANIYMWFSVFICVATPVVLIAWRVLTIFNTVVVDVIATAIFLAVGISGVFAS